MKKLMLAASVFALLGLARPAHAASFMLDDYSIDHFEESFGNEALDVDVAKALGPNFGFTLNNPGDNDTDWIPLFYIWTDEGSIQGDDLLQKDIKVTFDFSLPSFIGPTEQTGLTGALGWGDFGLGYLTWDSPAVLAFGATGLLRITLSDVTFGLDNWLGGGKAGLVKAKFTLLQEDSGPAPVPEPGTLALFGAGLAAASARLRRRRRTQQS